jgi:isoleucyl-tRNA synthetase
MGTLWNTYAFFVLYADIDKFDPTQYKLEYDKLSVMDKWLLSKLNSVVEATDNHLANYEIPEAARALQDFVDDMSNWYVRRCRERYWAQEMTQDKVNAYMTLYTALTTIAKAAAPMIPFMTEEIYQNLVRTVDKDAPESVHLCGFPTVNADMIDKDLEADMDKVLDIVVLGRAARNGANLKNRQPLAGMTVQSDKELSQYFVDIIREELNIKSVTFAKDASDLVSYTFKPQLKTLGPKYGKQLGEIRNALAELDGGAAKAELDANGALKLTISIGEIALTVEDLLIETQQKEGIFALTDNGLTVALDTVLTDELVEEGFVREIISKIQTMRKEAGFEVMDHIIVSVTGNERIAAIMNTNKDTICGDVLADNLTDDTIEGFAKEWNINGQTVTLTVQNV